MEILFFSEDTDFSIQNETEISEWLNKTIIEEHKVSGNINVIFCSDAYLLEINKTYLNHDYFTDIITFNYCEDNIVSGDLFISIDTIKSNSELLKVLFEQELHRVIIHGILHLLDYNDKTDDEKQIMRSKEDYYLNYLG